MLKEGPVEKLQHLAPALFLSCCNADHVGKNFYKPCQHCTPTLHRYTSFGKYTVITVVLHFIVTMHCPFVEWYFRSYHLLHFLSLRTLTTLFVEGTFLNFMKLNLNTVIHPWPLLFLFLKKKRKEKKLWGVD